MRICLIINPKAGQSRPEAPLPVIRAALEAWATSLEVRETEARGDAERWAGEITPEKYDLVIAAGGDGTINEVLNGLTADVPLGILPLGTANVLSRDLKIPIDDLEAACEILRTGEARPMDLGWCNGRRFGLVAGIGFDAQAVKEVPPDIKNLIGAPAYVLSGLRALVQMQRPLLYRLTLGKRKVRSRGMMLVVANAASYAGTLQLAPDASLDDGLLDLCLFREKNKLAFLWQWVLVLLRRQRSHPNFVYHPITEVHVRCDPPAAVQLDGDYFCTTPVGIRVLPGVVKVMQPRPAGEAVATTGETNQKRSAVTSGTDSR
jgi:YegS/Rv2252/BmrU family lipid kinase